MDIKTAIAVYRELHYGEPIDDNDLNDAIKSFEFIATFLACDPHLHLAWKEINHHLETLKGFQRARK